MKRNIYLTLIGWSMLFIACNKDDANLTPSYKDTDRVASQVDLTKPLVKYYFDNYQIGILSQFQDTLDFVFTATSKTVSKKWANVVLPKLDPTQVDSALTFLDTTLLQYFKKEVTVNGTTYHSDYFLQKMPKMILMTKRLYNDNENLDELLVQSDNRVSSSGLGTLHCLGNIHSFAFNTDVRLLSTSASKLAEFKNDNFYIFVSYVMKQNDLYSQIPASFYGSASKYYGALMSTKYVAEGMKLDSIYNLIDKNWFYSKGFIEGKYFYNAPSGMSDYVLIKDSSNNTVKIEKPIYNSYYFLASNSVYVRCFLNQMIYGQAAEFNSYPENIKVKFRILIETFAGWGVDMVAYNPNLNVLFN